MPPLPLAASCAHLFIPELVLKRRPRQLPDACASHWQCDPNDCGLPVLGTDASTEAAEGGPAPTEAAAVKHSTLTQLLRSGLMGHTRTALVVNVASEAEHADETICSLEMGKLMAVVPNKPTIVRGAHAATQLRALEQAAS